MAMVQEVHLMAVIIPKAGLEKIVMLSLQKLVAASKLEEGCMMYNLYRLKSEPNSFRIFEIWKSEEHLLKHKTQPHVATFLNEVSEHLMSKIELIRLDLIK